MPIKSRDIYNNSIIGIYACASRIEAGSSRQHGEMASEGPSGEEPDARS